MRKLSFGEKVKIIAIGILIVSGATSLILFFVNGRLHGEGYFIFCMACSGVLQIIYFLSPIAREDELKRKIELEIYSTTYKLVTPITFLAAYVFLKLANLPDAATDVGLVWVLSFLIEKVVRFIVHKKYGYNEEEFIS